MLGQSVTARACANIALVKYWGKRDAAANLPATGSLSLTLAALATQTTVTFDRSLAQDELELDGFSARFSDTARTSAFLDLVRQAANITARARVVSRNEFPTASGLASSAAGYAALALAASKAAGLSLSERELSILARRGSGSAARSIFGGFVRMNAGDTSETAYAEHLASALADRVRMVIAIVGGGTPKAHGSRDAMEHTAATSPYYPPWLDVARRDLEAALAALAREDLDALGTIAEANALAMHGSTMAARPAVMYWRPATIAVHDEVRGLRACGVAAWATMDAGAHVKILTTEEDAPTIAMRVKDIPGVTAVTISAAGPHASVV